MPAPKELADPLATSLVAASITSTPNLNPGLVITTHAILNMNLSESGKVLVCKGVGEEVEARVNAGTIRMVLSRYREMKKHREKYESVIKKASHSEKKVIDSIVSRVSFDENDTATPNMSAEAVVASASPTTPSP